MTQRRSRAPIPAVSAALAAALLFTLTACGGGPTGPGEPIRELPRELTGGEVAVRDAGNDFAFRLLGEVVTREEAGANVALSPLSASFALGMALNGARNETFDAMAATLGLEGLSLEEIDASYRDLVELLVTLDPAVETAVANSLWYHEDFPLAGTFEADLQEYFGARVEAVDFADPGTVDLINDWVDTETNGRIERLLEELRREEVMFLINALYFKAPWVHAFDADETRPAPFRRADGTEVSVEMMTREGGFRVAPGDGFVLLDLPYGGGAYSMTLLLPDPDRSLGEIVAGLDLAAWSGTVARLTDADDEARIHLPRFRIEYEVEPLEDALKAMGMAVAFDELGADFRDMVEPGATLGGNLYISRVVQKVFIEVNEEGTEAAAATGVGIGVTSLPPTYRLDRPFLFVIREGLSGTILFAGRVADPTAG